VCVCLCGIPRSRLEKSQVVAGGRRGDKESAKINSPYARGPRLAPNRQLAAIFRVVPLRVDAVAVAQEGFAVPSVARVAGAVRRQGLNRRRASGSHARRGSRRHADAVRATPRRGRAPARARVEHRARTARVAARGARDGAPFAFDDWIGASDVACFGVLRRAGAGIAATIGGDGVIAAVVTQAGSADAVAGDAGAGGDVAPLAVGGYAHWDGARVVARLRATRSACARGIATDASPRPTALTRAAGN